MDAAVTSVAVAALVADGILAGLSLDKVIVQLPARQRIGVTAYAAYARAADLGNGIAFYAAAGVGAAVLTLAAFGVAAGLGAPGGGDRAPGRRRDLDAGAQRHDRAGRARHVPDRPGRG